MPTLNIKDPEVYRLAHLLAERRRTSMTAVVREALERAEEADRPKQKATVDQVLALADELRAEMLASGGRFLDDDEIYDEWGLPT